MARYVKLHHKDYQKVSRNYFKGDEGDNVKLISSSVVGSAILGCDPNYSLGSFTA